MVFASHALPMQRLLPQLVERAAEIAGGMQSLARQLNVDEHRLSFWRQGTATAPNHVFVRLVDLILQDDIARAHADRRKQARAPDPHGPSTPRISI